MPGASHGTFAVLRGSISQPATAAAGGSAGRRSTRCAVCHRTYITGCVSDLLSFVGAFGDAAESTHPS